MTSSMSHMVRPIEKLFTALRTFEVVFRRHHFVLLMLMVTIAMDTIGGMDPKPKSTNLTTDMIAFGVMIMDFPLVSFQVEHQRIFSVTFVTLKFLFAFMQSNMSLQGVLTIKHPWTY